MQPYYADASVTLYHGDCIDVMRELPDNSVDAIVTDPPYGLGFMGKAWDDLPPGLPWAQECLRVLKPGGHLLAFGGTRTWHRLAVAVEDAGFEVRDSIAWLYGSGFPKSLDVSKAIDKAAGATREVVGRSVTVTPRSPKAGNAYSPSSYAWAGVHYSWDDLPEVARQHYTDYAARRGEITAPATPAAQQWAGWGTALKPAFEPIVVARKPLVGTVAANVLEWGTGALNIDGCRVDAQGEAYSPATYSGRNAFLIGGYGSVEELRAAALTDEATPDGKNRARAVLVKYEEWTGKPVEQPTGRWPANVLLDGHAAAELDGQSGFRRPGERPAAKGIKSTPDQGGTMGGGWSGSQQEAREVLDAGGGASRFFPTFRYQAKAPTRERPTVIAEDGTKTAHPTVKPLALMRWLVRLVTPPGGTVLDTFAGSGATIEAAVLEGFHALGIEREADYLPLIEARIARSRVPLADAEGDDDLLLDFGTVA